LQQTFSNSACSAQTIERAAELDIHLPKVLVKVVSECFFGKIPSDWAGPELLIHGSPTQL
jgi:hypothetical protein